jgi:hypothetical protein
MRRLAAFLLVLVAATAACGFGAEPSPTPGPSGPPAGRGDVLLSATVDQAIAPLERFGWLPSVVITADGVVVTAGAVLAIFPGPLVPPLVGRRISDEGWAQVLQWAEHYGLLTGQTDFTGGNVMPGQPLGRIRLRVGEQLVELVGDHQRPFACPPNADCDARPGSPEAFTVFWGRITGLGTFLAEQLGPEAPWEPAAYALLIGPAPDPQGIPQPVADWPLAAPLATIGQPVAGGERRCVTVSGGEAAALRPALEAARQTTPWIQDPQFSAAFGLTVRPLLPGEDVCRSLFGAG